MNASHPSHSPTFFPTSIWHDHLARWRFATLAACVALLWTEQSLPTFIYQLEAPLRIVRLQKSWNGELAAEVLRNWGIEGRKAARLSLLIDLPLIASYTLAFTGWITWARDRLVKTHPRDANYYYSLALTATIIGGAVDVGEDGLHAWLLDSFESHSQVSSAVAFAASCCASIKFAALAGGLLYILMPIFVRERRTGLPS